MLQHVLSPICVCGMAVYVCIRYSRILKRYSKIPLRNTADYVMRSPLSSVAKRMFLIYVSETYFIILLMDMYIDDIRINLGIIRRDLCIFG